LRISLLLFALMASAIRLSAQDPCSQCNTPLEKAAYDDIKIDFTQFTDTQFHDEFCSVRDAVDSGDQKTDASVLAQTFFAQFSQTKSEYHRLYQRYCRSTSMRFTSYDRGIIVSHLVHNESLRVWSHCMDTCMAATGFQSRLTGDDGKDFVFELKWRPALGVNYAKIVNFNVTGGTCRSSLSGKRVGTEWLPLHCTRNSDDKGVGVVYIDLLAKEPAGGYSTVLLPPPPPSPVMKQVAVEKPITFTRDRKQMICVKNPAGACTFTDPDNKVIGYFESSAPGPVTRLGPGLCSAGACGWIWRAEGYDLMDNSAHLVRFGFKTNSGDSMTINMTFYYNEFHDECVSNCASTPPLRVIPSAVVGKSR
jgi:hypothetical protein